MTINKAQGQTLTYCGVDLENNCFSHGQLYVAFSRVERPDHLYVYAPLNKTLNVVPIPRGFDLSHIRIEQLRIICKYS